ANHLIAFEKPSLEAQHKQNGLLRYRTGVGGGIVTDVDIFFFSGLTINFIIAYTFGVDEFEIGHVINQSFTDFPNGICKNKISIASSLQHRIISIQIFTEN